MCVYVRVCMMIGHLVEVPDESSPGRSVRVVVLEGLVTVRHHVNVFAEEEFFLRCGEERARDRKSEG